MILIQMKSDIITIISGLIAIAAMLRVEGWVW
jgi:hypothetical protein